MKKKKFKTRLNLTYILISMLMVILVFNESPAQLLTNNNVLISNSIQITVKGTVQNNFGTVISNSGTIDLTGNWVNNSGNNGFGISQGTVIMNGVNQSIQGTDQTVFNNLSLINGTKTIDLNTTVGGANATPTGVLNCNNAVLDLNSNTLTVNNPIGTAITTSTGYIISEDVDHSSKVTWKIASTTGIHSIPFGNAGGVQIPYSFNLITGVAGEVTASTYATVPVNTPYPVSPTMVTHVHDASGADNSANTVDRFWQVDKTGNGTAAYTFTYAATENAAGGNINIRAQSWNTTNLGWDAALPGQLNPTVQSVLVPGVNTNGAWALALASNPLPIELLSFTAKSKDNKKVECNWSTASEINNDFFTVFRSKDGINFEEVSKVDGSGTTNTQHNYSFTDNNPYKGVSYYRLKQTDFNGDYTFSQIENVLITDGDIKYLVYPNPNNGNFSVKFDAEQNVNAVFLITAATGRLVQSGRLDDLSGKQQINIEKVLPGFYFLQITNGDNSYLAKVQVIK